MVLGEAPVVPPRDLDSDRPANGGEETVTCYLLGVPYDTTADAARAAGRLLAGPGPWRRLEITRGGRVVATVERDRNCPNGRLLSRIDGRVGSRPTSES